MIGAQDLRSAGFGVAALIGALIGALIAGQVTGPAAAQTLGLTGEDGSPVPDFSQNAQDEVLGRPVTETLTLDQPEAPSQSVVITEIARGAVLRGLDKITGETTDMELVTGAQTAFGRLTVELGECRFPRDNPSGDAFAQITIRADGQNTPWFRGWMMASSPALSALDHPRYDVWVMRCSNT